MAGPPALRPPEARSGGHEYFVEVEANARAGDLGTPGRRVSTGSPGITPEMSSFQAARRYTRHPGRLAPTLEVRNTGFDILLFWFWDDWGKYGRSYEKIASHLATLPEVDQVVCVFPPEVVDDPGGSIGVWERRLSPKLALLTERIAPPAPGAGPLARIRGRARRWTETRALHRYHDARGFTPERTILWMFPPHPYIERLRMVVPHRLAVAHVIDDFTKFDRSTLLYRHAMDQYPSIGQWADVIFTASEANRVRFATAGVPCHLFPQAVDECFIATPSELPHRATGARPRLGYVGYIMERTDLALMRAVAARRPDWDLVLVGPEFPEGYVKASGLLERPNVRWLGERPNVEIPGFLQSLDVCLMPHLDNEYSRSMAPLKIYQYLGSGRPVVSTRVAGIDFAGDHVRVAGDAAEFAAHVQDCLDHDRIEHSAARIDIVRTETWRVRVGEMLRTATRAGGGSAERGLG
ncbi:MAG TPA: glycosyltransferase [Candidatus Limnocylindrales bacterium]|nr:glycosyltransferase [Candidatus Limnocylindrales bacterium]